jgi:hypothetical protein
MVLRYTDGKDRHRGRKLQWVTADFVLQNFFCDLTPAELAGLWCPIVDAVDQSHWNVSDDEVYLNLRQDSFDLISKMINGLHVGVAAHRATNTQARFRMLQALTKTDDQRPWPQLPQDERLYPTTVDGWKAYRRHYEVCQDDANFARIFRCFGQEGATLFTSITGNNVGEVLAGTINKDLRDHDVHREPTPSDNSTIDSTSSGQNRTAPVDSKADSRNHTPPVDSTSNSQSHTPPVDSASDSQHQTVPVASASQESATSVSTHTGPPLPVHNTDSVCMPCTGSTRYLTVNIV